MEYDLALHLGVSPTRIIYNGPSKSVSSFEKACLSGSIINLDSHRDIELLDNTLSRYSSSRNFKVAIRVNFDVANQTSRFGFDTSTDDFNYVFNYLQNNPRVSLLGFHCHFPNRELNTYDRRLDGLIDLLSRYYPYQPPHYLNIGGGYFSKLSLPLLILILMTIQRLMIIRF